MSKFKKLAVCGLAGVMALGVGGSLVACGGGGGTTNGTTNKTYPFVSDAGVTKLFEEFKAKLTESADAKKTEFTPTIAVGDYTAATKSKIKIATQFVDGDPHYAVLQEQINTFGSSLINDQSFSMENADQLGKFTASMVSDADMPDVIFYTSGAGVDKWRDSLVSRTELAKYDSAIKGDIKDSFISATTDAAVFPMKSGAEMIMYNTEKLSASVFTGDVDHMVAELAKSDYAVAARGDLPHYWLNHFMCSYLGAEEFNAFDGTQTYFTSEKETLWKNALKYSIERMRAIGFKGSKAQANEAQFYAGEYGCLLDGQWAASNLDAEGTVSTISIAAFPKGGVDNQSFAIGGITNGWYITKHAAQDAGRLKAAIEFVKLNNSAAAMQAYCKVGGGVPANGVPADDLTAGVKKFMTEAGKVPAYVAIDDRVTADAKGALMGDWTEGSTMFKLLNSEY